MKKWNLIIDVAECTNCNGCTLATMDEYVGNDWPGYAAPMPRHGHRWIDIKQKERGQAPFVDLAYVPTMCNHCDDAPCVKAARDGAAYKRPDGIIIIDPEKAKDPGDPSYRKARREPSVPLDDPAVVARVLRPLPIVRPMLPDSDVIEELHRPAPGCDTRFLCFWGDLDPLIRPHCGAKLEPPDPDSTTVLVRDVGHLTLPIHWSVITRTREFLAAGQRQRVGVTKGAAMTHRQIA